MEKIASFDINSHIKKMPFKFTLLNGLLLITPPTQGSWIFMEKAIESQSQRMGRCLSYFSVPVLKCHYQDNLQERRFSQQHLSSLSNWCTCLLSLNYNKTKIFLDIADVSRRQKKITFWRYFKGKLQMKIPL